MNNTIGLGFFGFVGALLVGVVLLLMSVTHIAPGYHGMRMHLSTPTDKVYSSGWYFINPIDNVIEFETRQQKLEATAAAASKDLQNVNTSVAINYELNPEMLKTLYLQVGKEYESRVFLPAIQESVKAATAKFTAEQMVTQREEVKASINEDLKARLAPLGINVKDVLITNFEFSASFNAAIEAKVTAEQQALTAKNKLEQTKYEAEQRIAQAKGEAEAIRIQAQAIQNQGGAEYVNLKAIEKWNGNLPTYMLGNGSVPFVNIK